MLTIDLERLGLPPGSRVLDLGCGRGRHTHALAALGRVVVVGLDQNREDLEAAREGFSLLAEGDGWSLVEGDALRLPFRDAAFDAVVCSEVLEHLPLYEQALDEIARVTKPGGVLAVSVPRRWPESICWALSESYRTAPGGHVRIFDARRLRDAVARRGFSAFARHGAHALHSPYWWLRCLIRERTDSHPLVALYRRLLEWDLMTRPSPLRHVEAALNPVLGKSIVMYFRRAASHRGAGLESVSGRARA
jgi:SAM-dependent methyltransferase